MSVINKIYNIKILKNSIYFKIIFMLWALLDTITYGQHIAGIFSLPIIAWGSLLVLKNVFSKKAYISKITLYSIYAFLLAYVVTIIVNIKYNLVGNSKTLVWQAIMMLVLFISEGYKSKQEVIDEILIICKTIILISIIFSGIAIGLFFMNIKYQTERVDGTLIYQGYHYARLWGIYVDPNQATAVAQVSIIASLITLLIKPKVKYIFLIINILVQYVYIILAHSRGGEIAFAIASLILIYLLFEYFLKEKISKRSINIIISALLSIIVTSGLIMVATPIRQKIVSIPNLVGKVRNEINKETNLNIGSVTENVVVDRYDLDSSNGRVELWSDGFKLITYSPVWGFGDRNISLEAANYTPGSTLENKSVHNGFIHMVLSGGLVAIAIMIIIILSSMIPAIKVLFSKNRYKKEFYLINFISVIVGILLTTSMFLTEVFYKNSFSATTFWIFMGYSVYLTNDYLKEYN